MLIHSREKSSVRSLRSVAIALSIVLCASVIAPATESQPPDLSGTWAMVQFMPEIANLPFLGETFITAVGTSAGTTGAGGSFASGPVPSGALPAAGAVPESFRRRARGVT